MKARVFGVLCMLMIAAGTLVAHHSHAAFDISQFVTVEGTVTQVNWANPHVVFFVEGRRVDQPDAPLSKWMLENPAISNLQRAGWNRNTVVVGTKVVAKGHPIRGSGQMVLVRDVTVGDKVFKLGVDGIPYLQEQERRQREGRATTEF